MLKEQLNEKITSLGLSFDSHMRKTGPKQKPVDGYIQLLQTQKQLEDLQAEYQRLNQQSDLDKQSFESEIASQKEQFQAQIADLEQQISSY